MKKQAALPDTNFILRYLLRDVEDQFAASDAFFENVRSGRAAAVITESVLVECLYILIKYYHVSRADAAMSLSALLRYKGIANSDKEALTRSLTLFTETSLDPVDCILAARAAVAGNSVMTFDKALNKLCANLLPPIQA